MKWGRMASIRLHKKSMKKERNNMTNLTKVVTSTVRLSYANVWEPKSINGGKEKYSVSIIIPKSDQKTIE